MTDLVDYKFIKAGETVPDEMPDCLYQYLVGRDGIYVRARRPGLHATIGISGFLQPARGLGEIYTGVTFVEPVPSKVVQTMLGYAWDCLPNECLFYLRYKPLAPYMEPWQLIIPDQIQLPTSVFPKDPYNPLAKEALIEIHSHGHMDAFFSATDNRDETGFRIYAVLGKLGSSRPAIGARVGVYGHFCPIPAGMVFELPQEWSDTDFNFSEKQYADSQNPRGEFPEF